MGIPWVLTLDASRTIALARAFGIPVGSETSMLRHVSCKEQELLETVSAEVLEANIATRKLIAYPREASLRQRDDMMVVEPQPRFRLGRL